MRDGSIGFLKGLGVMGLLFLVLVSILYGTGIIGFEVATDDEDVDTTVDDKKCPAGTVWDSINEKCIVEKDIVCLPTVTPQPVVNLVDRYNTGTASTSWYKWRRIGSDAWETIASGSAFDADPFEEVEIYADFNYTTGYGIWIDSYTVPCFENPVVQINGGDLRQGLKSTETSITTTWYNPDGDASGNFTLGSGAPESIDFKIRGQFQKDYGNIYLGDMTNTLVCYANSSTYDDLTISDLTVADVPGFVASSAVSGNKYYAWEFPVLTSDAKHIYTLIVDPDDSTGPDTCDEVPQNGTACVQCALFDGDYDIDADLNKVISGREDEDDNDLGYTTTSWPANFTIAPNDPGTYA